MEGACEFFTQSVVSALGCKRAHLSIRIPSCLLSCQSVHCLFLFLSFWRVVYGPVSRCWQIRFYEKILMLPFVDSLSLFWQKLLKLMGSVVWVPLLLQEAAALAVCIPLDGWTKLKQEITPT